MTTNNFTMLAQNSDFDYVTQSCLAAMSIRATNNTASICLITNDPVPVEWQSVFDQIIPIPWTDQAEDTDWKISKIFLVGASLFLGLFSAAIYSEYSINSYDKGIVFYTSLSFFIGALLLCISALILPKKIMEK